MCIACVDDHSAELVCEERLPDYLRQTYLFQDLTDDQLDEVVSGLRTKQLEDGGSLFRQGDPARWFYVLREGHIALYRQSAEGRESIIAIVGPDEVFGEELLFLEAANHDLNARAVGDCTLLRIDRAGFRSFLEGSPSLGFRLMGTLYRRQRLLFDHIERLTLQDATQRLMAYLLDQVSSEGGPQRLELALPKSTLASHLAIQPETLSRILARLKECELPARGRRRPRGSDRSDARRPHVRALRAALGLSGSGAALPRSGRRTVLLGARSRRSLDRSRGATPPRLPQARNFAPAPLAASQLRSAAIEAHIDVLYRRQALPHGTSTIGRIKDNSKRLWLLTSQRVGEPRGQESQHDLQRDIGERSQ